MYRVLKVLSRTLYLLVVGLLLIKLYYSLLYINNRDAIKHLNITIIIKGKYILVYVTRLVKGNRKVDKV